MDRRRGPFAILALEAYAQAAHSPDAGTERTIAEIVDGSTRPLALKPPGASFLTEDAVMVPGSRLELIIEPAPGLPAPNRSPLSRPVGSRSTACAGWASGSRASCAGRRRAPDARWRHARTVARFARPVTAQLRRTACMALSAHGPRDRDASDPASYRRLRTPPARADCAARHAVGPLASVRGASGPSWGPTEVRDARGPSVPALRVTRTWMRPAGVRALRPEPAVRLQLQTAGLLS